MTYTFDSFSFAVGFLVSFVVKSFLDCFLIPTICSILKKFFYKG